MIEASLKALIDGHYLRAENGAIGAMDPAKMDAIGDYLFTAGILRDADGKILAQRPDFAKYFANLNLG